MLDLNVEVNINTNRSKFPIKLIGVNKCLHCGGEGTLQKIDIFGRTAKEEIWPLDHIKCSACGQEYSIEWKDLGDGKLTPIPTNMSLKQEVINTMGYLKIRRNGDTSKF